MSNQNQNEPKDAGFWAEIWQQLQLAWRLFFDSEVPLYLKVVPFAGILYLLWPADLLPFPLPVFPLDDITVLFIGLKVFIELAPAHIVARHLANIRAYDGVIEQHSLEQPGDNVIEGEIIIDNEHQLVMD